MSKKEVLRVAVLGFGAIGKQVVAGISNIPGVSLTGVVVRRPGSTDGLCAEISLQEAIECSDLIVECAGGEAIRTLGPQIIAAGKDMLAVSFGQLADEDLRQKLLLEGPGRTYLSTGAIGGLDMLSAATIAQGLDRVTLTSNKLPKALIQGWMSEADADKLLSTADPVTVFEGGVDEAIKLFPASLNIAVAVAQATGLWTDAKVRLVADPQAKLTKHTIEASGATGNYRFEMLNEPSADNPATSGVVSKAILRGIAALAQPSGTFI